jgi:hypothetical protein
LKPRVASTLETSSVSISTLKEFANSFGVEYSVVGLPRVEATLGSN